MISNRKYLLSRREMLAACATVGTLAITSNSLGGLPQNSSNKTTRPDISLSNLKYDDNNVTSDLVSKALAQTMDQFQTVREFEIDPLIDPAVIFQATLDDAC